MATLPPTTLVPDASWRRARPGRTCVFNVGPGHRRCGRPAVFELNRGQRTAKGEIDAWWPYCDDPEHTYHYIWLDDMMYWVTDRYGWLPDGT